MGLEALVDAVQRTFTGLGYGLTLVCGLLSLVEGRLFKIRRYKRESAVNVWIGWLFIVGGTLVFWTFWILARLL